MDKNKYKLVVYYLLVFDSILIDIDDLFFGFKRLLEIINLVVLFYLVLIKVLVILVDVLYSWVVFSLGIKVDVVLGCLN